MKFKAKSDSWLMRCIGFFRPDFLSSYWTTIGETIYYPTSVENPYGEEYFVTVEHEKIHIKQYRKYGKALFLFLYLFVPLPVLFSYFRWKFEREAYLAELREYDQGFDSIIIPRIAEQLWRGYAWCWPKSWMRKWFYENRPRM